LRIYSWPVIVAAFLTTPATLTETINIETAPDELFAAGETGLLTSGGTVIDITVASRTTPLFPLITGCLRLKATANLASGNRVFQWQSQPALGRGIFLT